MAKVYVLGAGAWYSSPAPQWRIPLQRGFFAESAAASDEMLPELHISLQQHPMPIWLALSGLADPNGHFTPDSRLFTDRSIYFEDLYAQLENDTNLTPVIKARLLDILDFAIFKAIAWPVTSIRNDAAKTCPLHNALVAKLIPGDTVISLNYDSLIDDALLHWCPFWHPLTGYNVEFDEVIGGALPNKSHVFDSLVALIKPHGSVTFRYRSLAIYRRPEVLYVGLHDGHTGATNATSSRLEPHDCSAVLAKGLAPILS